MSADPFRKTRKPCSRCGRKVHTLAKVTAPVCRPCRASLRNLERQPYRAAAARKQTNAQRRSYWRGYKAGRAAERKALTHKESCPT